MRQKSSILTLLLTIFLPLCAFTQSAHHEEVLLAFQHPAIGHVYVGSLYDSRADKTYLPVTELFSLLEINYQSDIKNFTIRGNFISPGNPYSINLAAMQVTLGKTMHPLTPEDFRIGAMDFYLSPQVFEKIFGLNFTVNIMHLVLSLETTHKLPVAERLARERARSRMEGTQTLRDDFPMVYPRKRQLLSGGMLDYALTGNVAGQATNMGYVVTGGMEFLGGDLQGSLYGNIHSDSAASGGDLNVNGLRWRYAVRDNRFFSGLMAGQLSTTGLQPYAIRGVAITNDPIEPRRMYETFVVDGNTEPESEVEIYVNERLTDYKRADELGYYRFDVGITYGTTRISLRIYTPSGELKIIERQMQVPFTFLPPGVISYNIQAGMTEPAWGDALPEQAIAHGNVAVGITRWLSASAGTQHIGRQFQPQELFSYGSLSARLAKQYLLNVDIAPEAFYRLTGSVMYTSNLSLNMVYTRFDGQGRFNARNANEEVIANVYLPFSVFGMATGIRLGGEHHIFSESTSTRCLADFNARLGAVNLRVNFRENIFTSGNTYTFSDGQLTTALTYTIARSPGIPVYVRGMFLRGQAQYDIHKNQLQVAELQLSRTVFKTGRLTLGGLFNFDSKTLNAQFGLTFDLRQVRSATTIISNRNNVSARQSLSGSIGIDAPNRHLDLTNRQQVGRSAVSVVQFVDNNNSGKYDRGDQRLPYRSLKLDRSTTMEMGRDSILRMNQLQSYFVYNLSVNRNAIDDPTLVPQKNEFSFIADPNRYKRIEIPFYRGGIVEGMVMVQNDGKTYGQGGLRLFVKGVDNTYEQTIRTFADGGFYSMDIPPGAYTIEVDPVQLGFLRATQSQPLKFQIRTLAEGDYLEGLTILLQIEDEDNSQRIEPASETPAGGQKITRQTTDEAGRAVVIAPVADPNTQAETGVSPISLIEKERFQETEKPSIPSPATTEYRVQIASRSSAVSKQELALKFNIPKEAIKEDRYKASFIYTVGSFPTREEAQREATRLRNINGVKDAFVVVFIDGARR